MKTYYATEYQSIRPTRDFTRAVAAAEREADQRGVTSTVYENGRDALVVHPAA